MSKPNKPLWLLLLAVIGLNTGCTHLTPKAEGDKSANGAGATAEPVSEDAVNAPLPNVILTPTLLYRLLMADFAEQGGDLTFAADQYLKTAEETRDPRLAKHATRIAMYANDTRLALRAATLWRDLAPDDRDADQAQAAIFISAGELAEARPHLQRIIDSTPGRGHGYLITANLLSRAPNREQALAMMDELVRPHSQEPDALFAAATLAAQIEKPALALERLDKLLRVDPHHLQGMIMKARILYGMDRKEEAIATLRRAVDEAPDNAQLRLVYARMLVDERHLEEARREFRAVDRLSPNDPDVIYALGLLALQADDLKDGEKQFQRLLTLGQREDEANFNLGQIAESRNEIDKAIVYYEAVNDGENELDAHLRAAMLIARRDGLDKGRDYLHKLHPSNAADSVKVSLFEGELLRQAGRNADAMSVYNDALVQSPDNSELLYARAMVAENLDRLDILEQDLRAILRKNPNDAQALNALGYTLADRTNRLDEARQLIEKAMKLSPNDAAILDSMGWVLYRQGHNAEALGYLKQALTLQNDGEIAAHLGEVLWVSGQHDEAHKVWDKALKQTPDNPVLRQTINRLTK